jgi:thiamine biosynthesis lipoprotein
MGSDVEVVVVDGPAGLADRALARIGALERRWSRFLPDSEVSRLSARAGTALRVSHDTVALVERAVEAWRFTGGTFDPTVLGAVIRAGYDRSFDLLGPSPGAGSSPLLLGCTDIEVLDDLVRLPAGTGFDPGGIGKGLAADLVATELIDAGASGACINMGGDLRGIGTGPGGGPWTVAIDHPAVPHPLASIGIEHGGVATSTTLRRSWVVGGETRHHLIDPSTGDVSTTDLELVTVIAGEAWSAEVLAKAVLLRGAEHPFDLIDGTGVEALIVTTSGHVRTTPGFARFTGEVPPPSSLGAVGSPPAPAGR